jgi:hypothetical protein
MVAVVPETFDPRRNLRPLLADLECAAQHSIRHRAAPGTRIAYQLWTVTDDPDEVRAWDMPHVCATCVAGQLGAIEFLASHPGRYVAFATLAYDEPDPARDDVVTTRRTP